MQLRPYQSEQSNLLRASFRMGHRKIILCSPTGSGKSLVMSDMTQKAYEKGSRVILLTHRMELFKSTLAHLGESGIPCIEITAGKKMPVGDWRVALCMEKTLWNIIRKNPDSILQPDLIIADEIHFQNFSKIIDHFSDARLIGFSATPSGKHIHKIYTDIIQNIDIPELIAQWYLVPCKAYQMQDNFDDVKISKGEFEDKALFQHFNRAKLYDGLIDEFKKHVSGKKTMVFCCNVEHTEKTAMTFSKAGFEHVFMVHSKMSNQLRTNQINGFQSHPDGIMVNCGILTTGYDHPPVQCIVVYRATTSLPLWLQMQGRGSRIHPGKNNFTVLDFGQNHNRHGLWNQPRTWSLDPPKKRNKTQAAPVRECPQCSAMLFATVRLCEFCGYEFPIPTSELREGVMCEVNTSIPLGLKGKAIRDLNIDQLISLQKTKKISAPGIWRIIRTNESEQGGWVDAYAQKMGYSIGWAWRQKKDIKDRAKVGYTNKIIQ